MKCLVIPLNVYDKIMSQFSQTQQNLDLKLFFQNAKPVDISMDENRLPTGEITDADRRNMARGRPDTFNDNKASSGG